MGTAMGKAFRDVKQGLRDNLREGMDGNGKLGVCPDCGKVISKAAVTCPYCGRPLKEGDVLSADGKPWYDRTMKDNQVRQRVREYNNPRPEKKPVGMGGIIFAVVVGVIIAALLLGSIGK